MTQVEDDLGLANLGYMNGKLFEKLGADLFQVLRGDIVKVRQPGDLKVIPDADVELFQLDLLEDSKEPLTRINL